MNDFFFKVAQEGFNHMSVSSTFMIHRINRYRIGDEERRLMHLVPAPAVRLMKMSWDNGLLLANNPTDLRFPERMESILKVFTF